MADSTIPAATTGEAPIRYEIVTPTARIATGTCDSLIAPAVHGEIGILRNHAPFMGALAVGVVRVSSREGDRAFFVANGFIEVLANKIIILAEIAEPAEAIDRERAEKALERANENLKVGVTSAPGEVHDRLRARRAQTRSRSRLAAARSAH